MRDYAPAEDSSPESEVRLTDEEYARARAVLPVFCLDGLLCARDPQGPFVVLAVRADRGPSSGPFRGEPWVVGGRWDLRTPWEEFVRRRAAAELFGGRDPGLDVDGPIGDQLFATSWAAGDGPFGRPGLTLQLCYRVISRAPPSRDLLQPDDRHCGLVEVRQGDDLERYHPYVRDVIERSGWLDSVPSSP